MKTKTFDAAKLMRELRDRLSREMEKMTPEERVRYIRDRAASTGLGKKLAEDEREGAREADAADRPPVRRPRRADRRP